jgi:hypothetical protein
MKSDGKLRPILADSDSRDIAVKGDEVLNEVTLRSVIMRNIYRQRKKNFDLWTRELDNVNISSTGGEKNDSWLCGMPTDTSNFPPSCGACDNPPFSYSLSNLMATQNL